MGIRVNIPEIQSEKSRTAATSITNSAQMNKCRAEIELFSQNTELAGTAYTELKEYYKKVYLPIFTKIDTINAQLSEATAEMITQFQACVGSIEGFEADTDKLNSKATQLTAENARLEAEIRSYEARKRYYLSVAETSPLFSQAEIAAVEYKISKCQKEQNYNYTIISKIKQICKGIEAFNDKCGNIYDDAKNNIKGLKYALNKKSSTDNSSFWGELKKNYGWDELLDGSNYIKTIYGFFKSFKSAATWQDYAKTGVKVYEFLTGAARTYKNYKLIGNAVGSGTARTWWVKNIIGWKPLGRASSAKNVISRFKNNFTNKTSQFNAQFKNVVGNFTGANGVGTAIASWGTVLISGIVNYSNNRKEQAESGGTMSDGRVIAETITETVVDTALTYGAGIVAGAAVTTVLGTVAAPGVVVVALSGLLVAGVNAAVKATTGKSTTEWVSDTILDTGSYVAKKVGDAASYVKKKVGNAVSNATKTVANWFGKLSFA